MSIAEDLVKNAQAREEADNAARAAAHEASKPVTESQAEEPPEPAAVVAESVVKRTVNPIPEIVESSMDLLQRHARADTDGERDRINLLYLLKSGQVSTRAGAAAQSKLSLADVNYVLGAYADGGIEKAIAGNISKGKRAEAKALIDVFGKIVNLGGFKSYNDASAVGSAFIGKKASRSLVKTALDALQYTPAPNSLNSSSISAETTLVINAMIEEAAAEGRQLSVVDIMGRIFDEFSLVYGYAPVHNVVHTALKSDLSSGLDQEIGHSWRGAAQVQLLKEEEALVAAAAARGPVPVQVDLESAIAEAAAAGETASAEE